MTLRIVMMGTGTFAEPTLEALLRAKAQVVGLVTQPERDTGNKRGSTRQVGKGMAAIAHDAEVPVLQPESINTPEGIAALRAMSPDLLVVAAYGQILSKELLMVPTRGAINVHASLLPKYRGASPIAHAILAGETQSGVTIIKITPGLDAGEMLAKDVVDILPDETTGELEIRLAALGAVRCLEIVNQITLGPVSGEQQDPTLVTRAPKLKKEQGLIPWTKTAQQVHDHIRAMRPWPTPFSYLHRPGKEPMRVIVVKCSPHSETTLVPGQTEFLDGTIRVGCGVGELWISELQPAGKRLQSAEEFVRGYPLNRDCRFGPEHS